MNFFEIFGCVGLLAAYLFFMAYLFIDREEGWAKIVAAFMLVFLFSLEIWLVGVKKVWL